LKDPKIKQWTPSIWKILKRWSIFFSSEDKNYYKLNSIQIMIEVTFKSFLDEYANNLKEPSCIPTCMEEICGGCKLIAGEVIM